MGWNAPLEDVLSKLMDVLKESGDWRFVGKHLRCLNRYWRTKIDGLELHVSMIHLSDYPLCKELPKILQKFLLTSFRIDPQYGRIFKLPKSPKDAFQKLRRLEIARVDNGDQILREMFDRAPNMDSLFLRSVRLGDEMLKKLESFQSLTELYLDLEYIRLNKPCSFSNLQNLKRLTILGSSLIDLSTVATLSNLQSLEIGPDAFDNISSLIHCKRLTSLKLILSFEEHEIPILARISSLKHFGVKKWNMQTRFFRLCTVLNLETIEVYTYVGAMKLGSVNGKPLYAWFREVHGLEMQEDQNYDHILGYGIPFRELQVGEAVKSLEIVYGNANSILEHIHHGLNQLRKLQYCEGFYRQTIMSHFSSCRHTIRTLILSGLHSTYSSEAIALLPNLEEIGFKWNGCSPRVAHWSRMLEQGNKIHTVGFDFRMCDIPNLEDIKTFLLNVPKLKRIVWCVNERTRWLSMDFIQSLEVRGVICDRDDRFFSL